MDFRSYFCAIEHKMNASLETHSFQCAPSLLKLPFLPLSILGSGHLENLSMVFKVRQAEMNSENQAVWICPLAFDLGY